MVFITAGMGGGTGTGAAPVVAEVCMEKGALTVAVVTKPFSFEGRHRSRLAHEGTRALQDRTDTLIVIPNQNLFKLIDQVPSPNQAIRIHPIVTSILQSTSVMDAFGLADDVLLAGVKSITDLMVRPGLINLDFADVQSVMSGMGNAIMGTGQATGEDRALRAAVDALKNPLLGGDISIKSAKGMLVNITGGADLTLYEVDMAAQKITSEVEDENANIIFGSSFDPSLEGSIRVSVVATGIDHNAGDDKFLINKK
jgi:cell division protein FtsZ